MCICARMCIAELGGGVGEGHRTTEFVFPAVETGCIFFHKWTNIVGRLA